VKGSTGDSSCIHWGPLIVLDAGQFSTRCRCCGWRSGLSSSLTDALAAFQRHPCLIRAIGSFTEPVEAYGRQQIDSINASSWSDETRFPAARGVRPRYW
jgi:hypothetical protein